MSSLKSFMRLVVACALFGITMSARAEDSSYVITSEMVALSNVYTRGFVDAIGFGNQAGTNSVGSSNCIFVGPFAGIDASYATNCAAFGPFARVPSAAQYRFAYGAFVVNDEADYSHVFGHGENSKYVAFRHDEARIYTPLSLYNGLRFAGGTGTVDFTGARVAGLSASQIRGGQLAAASMPASGQWDASGLTILNAALLGDNVLLTVTNGLTVTSSTNQPSAYGQYALEFNGENYAKGSGDWNNNLSALTIEAWIRPDSIDNGAILSQWADYDGTNWFNTILFAVHGDRRIYIEFRDEGNNSYYVDSGEATLSDGWNHVAGVWDGAEMRLYINGVLTGRLENAVAPATRDAQVSFGPHPDWVGGYMWEGRLAMMRICTSALYSNTFEPEKVLTNLPSCVTLWNLADGNLTNQPSSSVDASGNNRTLTLYGDPKPTWVAFEPPPNRLPTGALVFTPDGNLGIGTNAPSAKLHVVGDVRIDGNLTVNGVTTLNYVPAMGDIPMGSFTNSP